MKSEKKILIAFLLNVFFSLIELVGGIFTNSIAIISDSIHDMGDAVSIGISFILEKKSKKKADDVYTYGYGRYSVIGSVISTMILILGSVFVIYNAINRFIHPEEINYNGMLLIAVIGLVVNLAAAYFTRDGESLNQKAVSLHMLEDVLNWVVVLIGAIVMRFTDILIIDGIISLAVAVFIFYHAVKNLKEALDLFLEKAPKGIKTDDVKKAVLKVDEVLDVHHIHIWSIDGIQNFATMHIVVAENSEEVKQKLKTKLKLLNICHSTLELENKNESCYEQRCENHNENADHMHHHH